MKPTFKQFLIETSNLGSIGLTPNQINHIHKSIGLSHKAEFVQIKNKTEARKKILDNYVVIATNKDGEVFSMRHWRSGGWKATSSSMLLISIDNKDGKSDNQRNTVDVFKRFTGKDWKYYASTKDYVFDTPNYYKDDPDEEDDGEVYDRFYNKIKVLDPAVRKKATKLYRKARIFIMKKMFDEDLDKSESLDEMREYMMRLKAVAENGIKGYSDGFNRNNIGGAMADFFSTTGRSEDQAVDFEKAQKLATHKFVKFVLDHMDMLYQNMTTGGFEEYPKKADEYK